MTFIIPFILVRSRVQPPGETLIPVSICFTFVVYKRCCVCGCTHACQIATVSLLLNVAAEQLDNNFCTQDG